ncbi:DUF4282 domain-containing protein [bacterium]|nr:DUF4282 domain-containing protein [bacterium]
MADEFFYKFNASSPEVGPIDSKTLKQLAGSGAIQQESMLRRGTGDWVVASSVKGLFPDSAVPTAPPTAAPVATPTAAPLQPPAAAPVSTPPTATPVSPASAVPEAVPVAPAAAAPGGLNLPNLGDVKPAEAPAGLDSLVVAPKKPGGKSSKKPAPVAKKPAPPAAAPVAPNIEAPKVESPKAEAPKAEANAPDPFGSPGPAQPNPFASDPSPRRDRGSRGKKTGGFGSLLNFDVVITPTVIKVLFYIAVFLIMLGWIGMSGVVVVSALFSGDLTVILFAVGYSVGMLIFAFLYVVLARVWAEVVMVFFQINDNVRDIRDLMEERDGVVQ